MPRETEGACHAAARCLPRAFTCACAAGMHPPPPPPPAWARLHPRKSFSIAPRVRDFWMLVLMRSCAIAEPP